MTNPDRVNGGVHAIVQEELRVHACIEIYGGKTRVWNRAGLRPEACNVCGPHRSGVDLSPTEHWLEMLGTLLGHPDFVESHLQSVTHKQQVLLDRIPMVDPRGFCCCIVHQLGQISS